MRSLPNTTDGFRWSFDIRYHKTGQPTGRSIFPDLSPAPVPTLTQSCATGALYKALWEDARARLATTPHPDPPLASDAPYCA